jgi:hypothetical protein
MREQWITAHPGEYLIFFTGLPSELLQPIQVNLLLCIDAYLAGLPFVLLQPIQVNLLQCIGEFLADLPCVILQTIQVNLFRVSLHFYWPSIYAITVHPVKYVQYKGGPTQRPLLLYFLNGRQRKKCTFMYVRQVYPEIYICKFLFKVFFFWLFMWFLLNF